MWAKEGALQSGEFGLRGSASIKVEFSKVRGWDHDG